MASVLGLTEALRAALAEPDTSDAEADMLPAS
jgi:hypothetical protein